MKAILEFDLPEENAEYRLANKGGDYYSAISDIQDYLRSKIKYSDLQEKERKTFNDFYDEFFKILNDHNINLDE